QRAALAVELDAEAVAARRLGHRHLVRDDRAAVERIERNGIVRRLDVDDRAVGEPPPRPRDVRARADAADAAEELADEIDSMHAELAHDAARHAIAAEEPRVPVGSGRRVAHARGEDAPD